MGNGARTWGGVLCGVVASGTLGLVFAACASKARPPAGPEMIDEETDDTAARPECWPDCQTARWYREDLQVVLHEVTKCASGPVMVSEDLKGQVSVRFENLTCRDALTHVLKETGLESQRVSVMSEGPGKLKVHALLVNRPGESPERLVATAVPPFRRVIRSGPGIIEGGPMSDWERDREDRERERSMDVNPDAYWSNWQSEHRGKREKNYSRSTAPSADPDAERRDAAHRELNSDYNRSGDWKSPFDRPPAPRGAPMGPVVHRPIVIPYVTWRIVRIF